MKQEEKHDTGSKVKNDGGWKDKLIYLLGGSVLALVGIAGMVLKLIGKFCNCF